MKNYISILLITLSVAVGCKDFLVEEPVLSQSDVLTMSNYRNLDLSVAGAYGHLSDKDWYGGDYILRLEMPTPDGKKYLGTNFDTGRLNDVYTINFNASNTSPLWRQAYLTIFEVNKIMANLEGKGEEKALNNLKAECLFLRALSNFDLVLVYARPYTYTKDASHIGVPVVLGVDDPGAPSHPARNTVKEVYDQVIKDLSEAEQLIDPAYAREGAADPKSVVSQAAIQALLSRVYLYSGQWQKAADYATKVISNKNYTLWTAEDFKDASCFRQDVPKGGEIIFEVYDRSDNTQRPYRDQICYLTSPKGYPDGGASLDIINYYEDKDVRKTLFRSEDSDKGLKCYWTTKYEGKGLGDPDNNNVIVLRLSEMYLIRAEAGIRGAQGVNPTSDLAAIASRCGATPQPATLDGVLAERKKELAWEGHLWFDLARTGRSIEREDYVGSAAGKTLQPSDFRWVQAIPLRELDINKNLVQNEGYSSK